MKRIQISDSLSATAGAAVNTKNFDLEQYRKLSIMVVPDDTHVFSAKITWASDITGSANMVQDSVISSASQGNVISSLIDAKADLASIEITNGDSVAHTYNVYVFAQE